MLIENWYVILSVVALVIALGAAAYKFLGLPTKTQVVKIKKVLLYWVIQAEKELGSGTGQIKLAYTYELFVTKFKITGRLVSFETFSKWVDEALEQMKNMLATNEQAKEYIRGDQEKR